MYPTPLDLLAWTQEHGWPSSVTVDVDTETSGLYVDDGARVSTVTVSWAPGVHGCVLAHTVRPELIDPDSGTVALIASCAWPFNQGLDGKPEGAQGIQGDHLFEGNDGIRNLDENEWSALLTWLALVGKSAGLSFHNAKFDLLMLAAGVDRQPSSHWGGTDLSEWAVWDTQLVNAKIWPIAQDPTTRRRTTSLKPTAVRLWGDQEADEQRVVKSYLQRMRLPNGRWDLMPWSIVGKYAEGDARLTTRLRLLQRQQIEQDQTWYPSRYQAEAEIALELEIMRLLFRMEQRGLPYDAQQSIEVANQITQRLEAIAAQLPFRPTLPAAVDYFFNPDNPKGLRLPPYSLTDGGSAQLTEQVVDKLVSAGQPGASLWRDYQKLSRARTMWYTAYANAIGADGRLRMTFRQTGTVSGRFSGERVNLQAIPQNYRLGDHSALQGLPTPRSLIAAGVAKTPGQWGLWELDLQQAELRVAAQYAECYPMLDLIKAGADLHSITAQQLFSVGSNDPHWDLYRQVGKRANFSLIFGSGWDTFQRMIAKEVGLELGEAEARRIVRTWNALYPHFGSAIEIHLEKVQRRQRTGSGGWIGTHGGGRRWFERYEDAHKAFNQRVQGSLAILGKRWMLASEQILVNAELPPKSGLLLTIHDSQVLLLPDAKADVLIQDCQRAGRDLWDEMFPGLPGGVDAKKWKEQ